MKWMYVFLLATIGLHTFGCDNVQPGNYQGESKLTLRGSVLDLEASTDRTATTHIGLLWEQENAHVGDTISAQNTELTTSAFPFGFELALLDDPADGALQDFSPPACDPDIQQVIGAVHTDPAQVDYYRDLSNELSFVSDIEGDRESGTFDAAWYDTVKGGLDRLAALGKVPETSEEFFAVAECWTVVLQLEKDEHYLERGYVGKTGMAHVVVFDDLDRNGVLTTGSGLETIDPIRGVSAEHVVLCRKGVNDALQQRLAEEIINIDMFREGYNLARIVCEPGTTSNGKFEIVAPEEIANEEIQIVPPSELRRSDSPYCRY